MTAEPQGVPLAAPQAVSQAVSKAEAPPVRRSWTWRVYAAIVGSCAALVGVLTWLSSMAKDVGDLSDMRRKVAELIAPTPISLGLRDARVLKFDLPATLPDGYTAKIATIEIVGDKKGDDELRNCAGELALESGRKFDPVQIEGSQLSYTFPKGEYQQLLTYSFRVSRGFLGIPMFDDAPVQTKLNFRVLCPKIVSVPVDLIVKK